MPEPHQPPPLNILFVEQPSVRAQMAEIGAALDPAVATVQRTTAAAFNAASASEPGVEALLVSNAVRCDRAALARFPRLRAVIFVASGTESVDLQAATDRGIVVAHGHSEENAQSMAEATVLLMLALLYDLHRAEQLLRENLPPQPSFSRMLKGRVVGLVGFGKIAQGVMRRLGGWDVRFLVATRSPPASAPAGTEFVGLDALMARSDVVSLHAALTPQTQGMIGARQLELMRPGSLLINTGRGGLVDEAALARIAPERGLWLGLDTFAREPLPPESPLRRLPRTILTPHAVGHTVEGKDSLVRAAVANIAAVAQRREPLHSRNWPQVGWGARASAGTEPSTRSPGRTGQATGRETRP